MQQTHPFPQWTREERHRRMAGEICRYRNLGLADVLAGTRMIDVGCGTGSRTVPVAAHYGVGELVGVDRSSPALAVAAQVAREEGLANFAPVKGDVFDLPYPDGHFDVVVSWGVLHYTPDPERGFKELVRVCRPGGYVGIYVHNKFHHWRHNRRDGAEKRSVSSVLHRSDHTYGETLRWFADNGLVYKGSHPPLGFRDFLSWVRMRGQMSGDFPLGTPLAQRAARLFARMPGLGTGLGTRKAPPVAPTKVHLAVWQAYWAARALTRKDEFSGGSAFCGQKAV